LQCRGVTAVQRHDLSRMCTFGSRNPFNLRAVMRVTASSLAVPRLLSPHLPPPRRRKSHITKHNHKAQIAKHKSPFSMVCGRPGSQSHCACNSCSSILVTERPGSAEHLAAKLAAPFLDRSTGRPPRSRISARPPAAVPRNETRSVLVLGASSVRVDGRRKGGKRSLAIAAAPL